ncbi:hypothetical protein [Streptomyces bambusae]|uniref:hypothetical protein n=1 Tax=Streptomyces bambusae TaxID=1550616 RepID=UPI0021F56359|nr:hypothetical protein [Streptomyces bambusae]
MTIGLSLAGVAVGIIILIANLRPWWNGGRDPKALLPFVSGWTLGALATVCTGGALGWGAHGIAGLISRAGNTATEAVAGTSAAPVETARAGTLTGPGGVAVVVYLAYVVLLYRSSGQQDSRRILGGVATGAILGLLPGIAAMLGWLPGTANGLGTWAYGLVRGEVSL